MSNSTGVQMRLSENVGSGGKACFDHRGFGDAELVIGRLQPLVVEKRDANRAIGGKRGAKQARAARLCAAGHVLTV
jgi:hypothetical protein